MAYVITQNCCKDASCVPVCPVDCIHPTDPTCNAEMLYIDPDACIDCGACLEECPVNAIYPEEDLPESLSLFKEINAGYFQRNPPQSQVTEHSGRRQLARPGPLRVAIVGAGPSGCYAATELLQTAGVEVELFERLPTPFGLIRAGVAPDHQDTKAITKVFERTFTDQRLRCHLNVEIGDRLSHDDLMAHHHAVIYAVGASVSRRLDVPGEDLAGVHAAADFVGWYNGHPDHADHDFGLDTERAVIVGNGNVALDVARVLLMDQDQLATTDIAEHALIALSQSRIREVTILGRRGPREAAYSVGEYLALGRLAGVDVEVTGAGDLTPEPGDDIETATKLTLAAEYLQRSPSPGNRRIVFRFHTSVVEAVGTDRVTGLRVTQDDVADEIETALVLRSIGTDGTPVPGIGLTPGRGRVSNQGGRVVGADGSILPGVYVTGWIKRGPQGVIGTNRGCAAETVTQMLDDYESGALATAVNSAAALEQLLSERAATVLDWPGWQRIDDAERTRGVAVARPRVKFVTIDDLLTQARA